MVGVKLEGVQEGGGAGGGPVHFSSKIKPSLLVTTLSFTKSVAANSHAFFDKLKTILASRVLVITGKAWSRLRSKSCFWHEDTLRLIKIPFIP